MATRRFIITIPRVYHRVYTIYTSNHRKRSNRTIHVYSICVSCVLLTRGCTTTRWFHPLFVRTRGTGEREEKGVKNQKQKETKKKRRCWTQQTNMILRISFTNLTYFYLHVRVRARTKCVSIITSYARVSEIKGFALPLKKSRFFTLRNLMFLIARRLRIIMRLFSIRRWTSKVKSEGTEGCVECVQSTKPCKVCKAEYQLRYLTSETNCYLDSISSGVFVNTWNCIRIRSLIYLW